MSLVLKYFSDSSYGYFHCSTGEGSFWINNTPPKTNMDPLKMMVLIGMSSFSRYLFSGAIRSIRGCKLLCILELLRAVLRYWNLRFSLNSEIILGNPLVSHWGEAMAAQLHEACETQSQHSWWISNQWRWFSKKWMDFGYFKTTGIFFVEKSTFGFLDFQPILLESSTESSTNVPSRQPWGSKDHWILMVFWKKIPHYFWVGGFINSTTIPGWTFFFFKWSAWLPGIMYNIYIYLYSTYQLFFLCDTLPNYTKLY